MSTVLLRLEGPMQSWGLSQRGPNSAHRTTQLRPTKSAVIGLVANALGRDYHDPIHDLAALQFGVRIDRPGTVETDYHTSGSGYFPLLPGEVYTRPAWAHKAAAYAPGQPFDAPYLAPSDINRDRNGVLSAKPGLTVITHDWYLADASFLAALAGDQDLVDQIGTALAKPARTLFLGRRAYLPSQPILAGIVSTPLIDALTDAPAAPGAGTALHTWIEPDPRRPDSHGAVVAHDQPISYAGPGRRGARLEHHTIIEINPAAGFFTPDPQLNPEVTP
ncbi:CRISPR-associated protein Cas5 [Mycobacterium simiae]|uniref:CRISPR-associated protein Cas5 n=1 Tax=Mycobacterium simiae TaxID=1784 RepID=A0A5B1BKT0_MYCSI|nr:type I-E CRISPR-associated protein Cas5/CasD [Mycobacterium simiae]KAA1248581.1 CRISPR-associated protein Cas5 [Mycobacterium simiae]